MGPSAPYWVLLEQVQWEPKVTAGPTILNLWLPHLARFQHNQSRFICRFNTCKTDTHTQREHGSITWAYLFALDPRTPIVQAQKNKKKNRV